MMTYMTFIRQKDQHDAFAEQHESTPAYRHFLALCNHGEQPVSAARRLHEKLQQQLMGSRSVARNADHQLACMFSSRDLMGTSHANVLAPFKVEQFSFEPQITVFHDFVSEAENLEMLSAANSVEVSTWAQAEAHKIS
jgi:hypothetical protein